MTLVWPWVISPMKYNPNPSHNMQLVVGPSSAVGVPANVLSCVRDAFFHVTWWTWITITRVRLQGGKYPQWWIVTQIPLVCQGGLVGQVGGELLSRRWFWCNINLENLAKLANFGVFPQIWPWDDLEMTLVWPWVIPPMKYNPNPSHHMQLVIGPSSALGI